MTKYFSSILSAVILSLGVGVLVVHAQNYVPLAPLPGTFTGSAGGETTNLTTYLSGAIKLLVAVGAATAILMTIIGGTQYIVAGISPDAKSNAKSLITNAFIGLALILTSYLILNSINPELVAFKLSLESVTPEIGPSQGTAWGDDSGERNTLTTGTRIQINRPTSCTQIGEPACTSLFNLNGNVIIGLKNLDTKTCSKTNALGIRSFSCYVTITGATEYWLHQTHGDGTRGEARKVDLRKGDADGVVDNYIKKNGVIPETPCGLRNVPKYQPDGPTGGTYVDEGDHWHVCY